MNISKARKHVELIGKCVEEGFFTAVDNGKNSITVFSELQDIIEQIKQCCPHELVQELEHAHFKLLMLIEDTRTTCEEMGGQIQRLAQNLSQHCGNQS